MLLKGLLFSIFLEYVNPGNFIPVIDATKIKTILPLLVFTIVIFKPEPVSNGKMMSHANSKWLVFFLFLICVSVLTADVTIRSVDIFKRVFGNLLWFFMIVKLVTDLDKVKMFLKVMVFSHLLILILNPAIVLQPAVRSYVQAGPFLGDGNDFALSLCVVLPMCLFLLIDAQSKKSKLLYGAALTVLILAVIGTQSRGASVALAGSLGFLWWVGERKLRGVFLLGIVGIGILIFAPPEYLQRMESLSNYEQEQSAASRIVAWKTGMRMVQKYPITGVGAGHFPIALGREFRPPEWGGLNLPWMTAHSMYFLIIGELGIPGIVCLMSILIGNMVRLGRLRKKAKRSQNEEISRFAHLFMNLNVSLIAYCIAGAFLSVGYYPHMFVLCGLIVATTFIFEKALAEVSDDQSPISNGGPEPNARRPDIP